MVGLITLLLILIIPVAVSYLHVSSSLNKMLLSNNNPLYLVLSAVLVMSADRHRTYIPIVNYLATSVLAIYVITEYVAIEKTLNPYLLPYVMEWYGLLFIPLVCLACIAIDKLRVLLFYAIKRVLTSHRTTS